MTGLITLGHDVIRYLSDYLSFRNKVEFKKTCTSINNIVEITDFWHIPRPFHSRMTSEHLVNKPEIRYLRTGPMMTSIPYLPNLKALYVTTQHINEEDINLQILNLEELWLPHDSKIKNIGHMTNLKHLIIFTYNTEITGEVLKKLNLETLLIRVMYRDLTFNHMTNLRVLDCSESDICDKQLIGLNLRKLICTNNLWIKNIPYMSNLMVLACSAGVTVDERNLPNLKSLRLYALKYHFPQLSKCINLKKLYYDGWTEDVKILNTLKLDHGT